ncbi:MAG TPA: phosphotransferase, partial [Ktedonobacterales bacterium]|nr:phosphotransferase [Ktedonobacterales bacterium]
MPDDATTDTDNYLRVLAECVPGLTVRSCEVAGEGWDSVALLVNGELIVRIAKRADVALRLANEARLLPALAGMLHGTTLDVIPHFEYVCDDPKSGGKRLVAYRKLMGVPLTRAVLQQLPPDAAELLSYGLANFLSLLHVYPVEHAASLIVPIGRATGGWREEYTAFYAEVREHILPLLDPPDQERVVVFWEDYLADDANFRFEPCLIHRDL